MSTVLKEAWNVQVPGFFHKVRQWNEKFEAIMGFEWKVILLQMRFFTQPGSMLPSDSEYAMLSMLTVLSSGFPSWSLVSWVQGSWDMRFCYTCDKEVSSSWFQNPLVGNHFSMFLECIGNWVGAGEMAQWIELAMQAWCSASTYNLGTKTRTRNSSTEDWGKDLRSVGPGVSLVNPDARDGKHLVRWEALPQNRIK